MHRESQILQQRIEILAVGQWRIEPDSALYLSIARNLAEGQGYTYHGQPHNLVYPGLPYLLAGTLKVFGTETLWPAHALMLAISFATLALVYRLMYLRPGETHPPVNR